MPERQGLRRADVLWRATLDGVVIRRPGEDDARAVVKLGGTGRSLWDALDEPSTFDELCDRLAASHGAERAVVAADLAPVIEDLVARSVVERVAFDGVGEPPGV
jgi:hypothetical protein